MGFTVDQAKEMLAKHNGDVELAVEELASNLGRPDVEMTPSIQLTRLKGVSELSEINF